MLCKFKYGSGCAWKYLCVKWYIRQILSYRLNDKLSSDDMTADKMTQRPQQLNFLLLFQFLNLRKVPVALKKLSSIEGLMV
jgi:hypothetical protein